MLPGLLEFIYLGMLSAFHRSCELINLSNDTQSGLWETKEAMFLNVPEYVHSAHC